MAGHAVPRILTINTGSSSLKVALFEMCDAQPRLLHGEIERIGAPGGRMRLQDRQGSTWIDRPADFPDHGAALDALLQCVRRERSELSWDALGHRVVHGGARYSVPARITPELVAALGGLVRLAPDHLPQAIQTIQVALRAYPDLPQVACFDTAFHRRMPRVAQIYPLPRRLADEGVIRYGFHGLSYESIVHQLGAMAPRELEGCLIVAHLGNGASMAAVRGGIGVDTTMGFTPAGGLMMGTRSGDLDPGVLVYLAAEQDMKPADVDQLVNRQAGLLGVSGIGADMRDLMKREAADEHAAEAIALFCYQAKKYLGALVAILGGLNTLVITGGIGEHAASIRWRICEGLEFLGVRLDPLRNEAQAAVISPQGSSVTVRVMQTDEDRMIARHTNKLMESKSESSVYRAFQVP